MKARRCAALWSSDVWEDRRVREVVRADIVTNADNARVRRTACYCRQRDIHNVITDATAIWPTRGNLLTCKGAGSGVTTKDAEPVKALLARERRSIHRGIETEVVRDEEADKICAVIDLQVGPKNRVQEECQLRGLGILLEELSIFKRCCPIIQVLRSERNQGFVGRITLGPVPKSNEAPLSGRHIAPVGSSAWAA